MSRTPSPRANGSSGEESVPGRQRRCPGGVKGLLIGCLLLGGCSLPRPRIAYATPEYRPENVFLYAPEFAPDVKRVALLPLACADRSPELRDGCEALTPVVEAELVKIRKFEVVSASPEILRKCTGRSAWTGAESLPQNFFDVLREAYGCDAVLFCQLTTFRPYEPLAVGLRMKLVSTRTGQTLWAVDELLDAGRQSVLNGARQYQSARLQGSYDGCGDWLVRNSPRMFGQYAAAQMLATLPKR